MEAGQYAIVMSKKQDETEEKGLRSDKHIFNTVGEIMTSDVDL